MADNRVKVRIYGQEYTISGERDEETIREIAEYVDKKIKETAEALKQSGSVLPVPVLAAINIADDYFTNKTDVKEYTDKIEQLQRDCDNYLKMWEDAKKSFVQYKEGASKTSNEIMELENRIAELENKCSEYENSYFEVQMENMKLKEQLERLENHRF